MFMSAAILIRTRRSLGLLAVWLLILTGLAGPSAVLSGPPLDLDAAVWPELGVLTAIRDSDALFDAQAAVAAPAGSDLYVLGQDTLSHYRRDTASGLPSLAGTYADGQGGISGLFDGRTLAMAPDGAQVYAGTSRGLLVFARNTVSGALSFSALLPRGEISAIAVSSNGAQVYAASYWRDSIAVLSRNATTGALTQLEVQTNGIAGASHLGGPRALAISPDGLWLYAASAWSDAIAVFSRNSSTGRLTFSRPYVQGIGEGIGLVEPQAIVIGANGAQAYVASPWSSALTAWQRNTGTGALSLPSQTVNGDAGVEGLYRAGAVAIAPDGAALYVRGEGSLAAFARDVSTGALTFAHGYLNGEDGIAGLAGRGSVLAVGSQVYAAGDRRDTFTALTPLSADGGGIAGRVTALNGDPIPQTGVAAYARQSGTGDWQRVRTVWTDALGDYAFAGLPAATYRVCFGGDPSDHYLSECFDNAPDLAHAADLAVTAHATRSGVNAVLAERHLTGRVTDTAGTPLNGVTVTLGLWQDDPEIVGYWAESQTVSTGADGTYDVGGLSNASFRVCFSKPNYVTDCHDGVLRDTVLNASLSAAGHIAGTLTQVGGGALSGIGVWAWIWDPFQSSWQEAAWETTDANGHYDLRVGTGTYRVCFYSKYHRQQCYSNAANIDSATDVAVIAGQTRSLIDGQLTPLGRVAGRVTDAQGAGVSGVFASVFSPVIQQPGIVGWRQVAGVETDSNGDYELGGLAGGDYAVCFFSAWDAATGGPLYASQCYSGRPDLSFGQPDTVHIVAGQRTTGIDAIVKRPGSISGRVTGNAGAPLANIQVSVGLWVDTGSSGYFRGAKGAQTASDGTYRVGGLSEGTYQVCFYPWSNNEYVEECWSDRATNTRGNDVVVVSGQDTPHIDAVLYRRGPDAYEPDDAQGSARPIVSGDVQSRTFYRAGQADQDWVTFTLGQTSAVRLETRASQYHYLTAWRGAQFVSNAGAARGRSGVYTAALRAERCNASPWSAGIYVVSIDTIYPSNMDPRYTLSYRSAPCSNSVDTDADGRVNTADNCVFDANSTQADLDADGWGDACDPDDDNDGISDPDDNCPLLANTDQANHEGDALGDLCDADDDNDGTSDAQDAFPLDPAEQTDTDGDGIGNKADTDDDGDGYADSIDPDPLDPGSIPVARVGTRSATNAAFTLDLGTSTQVTVFGVASDLPVVGDWDGDGLDNIGIYRPVGSGFYLDMDGNDVWSAPDRRAFFGVNGDLPIAGDWDGDGIDEIGVFRPSLRRFYLDMDNSGTWTPGDRSAGPLGAAGDLPAVGDWDGNGIDDLGVYRPSNSGFYLDMDGNGIWSGPDLRGTFGAPGDKGLVGDWNGDGYDEVGVYRPSVRRFYFDVDANLRWNGEADRSQTFGPAGALPFAGRW